MQLSYKLYYDDSNHSQGCCGKKSVEVVTLINLNHKLHDKIEEAEFLTQIEFEPVHLIIDFFIPIAFSFIRLLKF
jgi:hypothetical protein